MIRTLTILIAITCQSDLCAQLMVDRYPPADNGQKIRVATDVPSGLGDRATLRFAELDICFDGGSHGATFTRNNETKLILFFANPLYWSPKAKQESKQPVAIQSNAGLVEITHGSALEARLLELLAADIIDGDRGRNDTLTLIRIRDCLLSRKPLREIIDRFDPKTWEPRPDPADSETIGDDE